ncbi:MAG: hypothetical protein IJX28_01500 [Clostridia bacterium]|nr:hypothetical protein [Clostridia bacterium]
MNSDMGLGSGSAFEYVVAEKKTPVLMMKRMALIMVYVLWAVALLAGGMMFRLIVPLLAFVPLSLWILVFLTWRFTQVEYEYSFFSGKLTVSRILGGRSRKELVTVTIRELAEIYPATEEFVDKANAYQPERTIYAASDQSAPDLYAATWKDEDGKRNLLWFEPNEKALKILRYYNASALSAGRKSY